MNQFKNGFVEVIVGIIGGIMLSAILTSFKENNLIPTDMVIWFTLAGFAGSIAMLLPFGKPESFS